MNRKLTIALALLAMLAGPLGAQAQAPAAPAKTTSRSGHIGPDRVEQRIKELHSQLQITPAEQSDWDKFAQVMRDNAIHMRQSFEQRGARLASMSAAENMQSYAELAEQHAQDMQKLSAAFQTLYASMSDAQKQTADALFRGRAEAHQRARG